MIFLGTSRDFNKSIVRETQSCELLSSDGRFMLKNKNLELDSARKTVSAARIKDDTIIMRNIKKREVVNALKGNGKSSSLGGLPNLNSSKKKLELRANFALSDVYEPNFKDSKFVTELLDWHNLLRARHGVKGLALDTSLCKKAQNWANYLAHTNEFHYQNPKEVKQLFPPPPEFFTKYFPLSARREPAAVASAHPAPLVPGQEGAGCDGPLRGDLLVQEPLLLPLPRRPRRAAELRKYKQLLSRRDSSECLISRRLHPNGVGGESDLRVRQGEEQ